MAPSGELALLAPRGRPRLDRGGPQGHDDGRRSIQIGHVIMEATVFWKIFAIWTYLTFVAAFVATFVVALDAQDRIHRDLVTTNAALTEMIRR